MGRSMETSSGEIVPITPAKIRNKSYPSPAVNAMRDQIIGWEDVVLEAQLNTKTERRSWLPLIDPRSSKVTMYWDMMTAMALVFTAIFTPIEVGFISVPEDRWSDTLFITNRFVDVIFLLDVLLQFIIMFPQTDVKHPSGERWVTDHCVIACHYMRSAWFPIDIISIGVSFFDMFAPSSGPISKLKGLRAIRVLRLIKLVRLVNASRIFRRWEMRLSINYAVLSISQVLVGLIFLVHLFACVWGLQATFDPLNSWPGSKGYCEAWEPYTVDVDGAGVVASICPEGKVCSEADESVCESPGSMYVLSVYFAIATITSVGYGDINATPFNEVEQIINTIIMYVGAIFFAYIVGSFCGLAAQLSPDKAQFRFDLSDLNYHMSKADLPDDLRFRLREYIHLSVGLRKEENRIRLVQLLSPGLAGEFAYAMNERWINSVWFLEGERNEELHIKIALELRAQVFPHHELVPSGSMYIVSGKGRALYAGRVVKLGQAFRTDELLEAEGLRAYYPAVALSYLWTYGIEGKKLRQIINDSPFEVQVTIKRHQRRLTIRRAVVRAAEEECVRRGVYFHGRRHPLYARAHVTARRSSSPTAIVRSSSSSDGPSKLEHGVSGVLPSPVLLPAALPPPPSLFSALSAEDRALLEALPAATQGAVQRLVAAHAGTDAELANMRTKLAADMEAMRTDILNAVARAHEPPPKTPSKVGGVALTA